MAARRKKKAPEPEAEHVHEFKYKMSIDRKYEVMHYYQCKCGECTHIQTYKFSPETCPIENGQKHAWAFEGTVFNDKKDAHEIIQVYKCFRCGAEHHVPRHTSVAGFGGRIEIEDPRVQNTLRMTQSTWERLIPKELQDVSKGKIEGAT